MHHSKEINFITDVFITKKVKVCESQKVRKWLCKNAASKVVYTVADVLASLTISLRNHVKSVFPVR